MNDLLQAPYSQEAEEATLGAIITAQHYYIPVSAFLKADDFFILRHRYVYEAIEAVISRSEPLDYLTLCQELKNRQRLTEIGGAVYITQLINSTPTSVHAEVYGKLVQAFATRRRLMAASDNIKAMALDGEQTVDDVLAQAAKAITDIQVGAKDDNEISFFDSVNEYFGLVESMIKDPKILRGISTGFNALDKITLGLNAPDLIITGGRPGTGKSSLLLSKGLNILRDNPDMVVGLFTLEMDRKQVTERAASMVAGINLQTLREGKLHNGEWKRFVKVMGDISKYNLKIDDRAGITPQQLRAKCYQWKAQHGRLDFIMVDYLQLMTAYGFKPGERVAMYSYISSQLKEIAKEFNIPVNAAAQLNRNVEGRADHRPQLSDLKESGALEQDADIVEFIYRDEMYNDATEFPNQAEIIYAKHRNGPTGVAVLYFEKTLTKFQNAKSNVVQLNRYDLGGDDENR